MAKSFFLVMSSGCSTWSLCFIVSSRWLTTTTAKQSPDTFQSLQTWFQGVCLHLYFKTSPSISPDIVLIIWQSIKECKYLWCQRYLGQEALDSRVHGDHVQEGRHELPEPRRRYADQECSVVAEADVVRVTDHVVHGDLLGASLRALQPVPAMRQRRLSAGPSTSWCLRVCVRFFTSVCVRCWSPPAAGSARQATGRRRWACRESPAGPSHFLSPDRRREDGRGCSARSPAASTRVY